MMEPGAISNSLEGKRELIEEEALRWEEAMVEQLLCIVWPAACQAHDARRIVPHPEGQG